MENEDTPIDQQIEAVEQGWEEAVVQIQERYWASVTEELRKILLDNPEIRAKFLDSSSPTAEEDFLATMITMMKEDAGENEDVLDA